MFHVPQERRIYHGPLRSTAADGNNGAFSLGRMIKTDGRVKRVTRFFCIASDGEGWEHVSVSLPDRCPTWEEMAWIKSRFWDAEDAVIQIHPPASAYVNNHPWCLHLWRKAGTNAYCEWPPSWMVGINSKTDAVLSRMSAEAEDNDPRNSPHFAG